MEILNTYKRWIVALIVLLVIIAALYLLGWVYGALRASSAIVSLYFSAWMLQFLFTPIVDFLTRRHLPRVMAVLYVYVVLVLAVVIGIVAVAPGIYNQSEALARELTNTKTYEAIPNAALGIERFLEQHGVPRQAIGQFTRDYSFNLKNGANNIGSKIGGMILSHLTAANLGNSAAAALAVFSAISSFLVDVVLVLILAFYMMLDGHRLAQRGLSYFPPAAAEVLGQIHGIINRKFGGYLRGQLILAVSYGLLTFIIATGFRLQYQIFIAAFAAVMMLIPFIGTFAAIVPPLVGFALVHVATPSPSFPVGEFLLLLAFLIGSQQIVINVLAPRVMGSAVGMHPLFVVLGLLLGVQIAGLWGAIFGVPVFAALVEAADLIYKRVMARRFGFRPPTTGELTAVQAASGATSSGEPPRDEQRADTTPLPRAGITLGPPS